MKKLLIILSIIITSNLSAKTINIGAGISYYKYMIMQPLPIIQANYELNISKNFTLAPFINLSLYRYKFNYGNTKFAHRDYIYRETIIPIGLKACYYLSELTDIESKWLIYIGGSIEKALISYYIDKEYFGPTLEIYHPVNPLIYDLHIGIKKNISKKSDIFLNISTALTTIGLSIH